MNYYKGSMPLPPGAEARMLWEKEQKILHLAEEQEFLQKIRVTFLLFAEKMVSYGRRWPR